MSAMNLVRPSILNMKAYESARSLIADKNELCFLDANENRRSAYSGYPDPQPEKLLQKFSQLYDLPTENILVTRGSDEGIDCVIRTFCEPGKSQIGIFEPTYDLYQLVAQIQGVKTEVLKLDENFQIRDFQCNSETKVYFICHPNNPTGNLMDDQVIQKILQTCRDKAIVVVDEAYIEFSESGSLSRLIHQFDNLVVLRTLSKAYALAGLRCGITLASAEIIKQLKKVLAPYPIPSLVSETLLQTPLDFDLVEFNKEKSILMAQLRESRLISKVYSTDSNFVLCEVKDPEEIYQKLLSQGVLIRKRDNKVAQCVRITIGTAQDNARFLEALKKMEIELG